MNGRGEDTNGRPVPANGGCERGPPVAGCSPRGDLRRDRHPERASGIVQLRAVVLIALLALLRKLIILDASRVSPLTILGLAAAVLALGVVHWLVRDQDWREAADDAAAEGTQPRRE